MEGTGVPKMILNTKPEGRRGVGKTQVEMIGDVEADVKTKMQTKNSRQNRMDRSSKGG
jgi:hypothetical protein